MTKRDFIAATKHLLRLGRAASGKEILHEHATQQEQLEDADLVSERILKVLQNMPAGEFRDLKELNYDY